MSEAPHTVGVMSFIAISGRLDWDPALVFEPDETPFVRCRVKTHHEPAVVYNVEARGDAADNAAVSLLWEHPVLVHGRLGRGTVVDDDGTEREDLVLYASALGPDLTHASVKVLRPWKEEQATLDSED